ncbi:MAG: histidine kinase [Gemmatimonadota bacterium]|nr:histidine kinase [Gemmatimonadota bacterium]MDH3367114.1 histidine kinase [Gemmatimonadota bacterium]MDH3476714.1 histidine kinase [Gemmatimonadota bacterium]MDH5549636.1 histidine kinase [Gemmatimonadota bacterium]
MTSTSRDGGGQQDGTARSIGFQYLMSHRVRDILLVTSLYDSFILAEDGQLGETILGEFLDLNLRHSPELTRVSTGVEALALATQERRYDLIISSLTLGDMTALELAQRVADAGLDVPVVALAYDARDLANFQAQSDLGRLERVFLWQGNVKILFAIVKYIEDRRNLAHDTGEMGVPAIILVEDNIRYYSAFLPVIYSELMQHAHNLMPEGLNIAHKLMRIRARPKILLCQTYEEAWEFITAYPDEILGIISDIQFSRGGNLDRHAGVKLARQVRALRHDIPIMLQSSWPDNAELARQAGASFLLKGSPMLLHQLRAFMAGGFGFGDFVFRRPDGSEVDRATDLHSLMAKLETVPGESIAFHASGNHFSRWLKTRTEFALAEQLRPRKLTDFDGVEALRAHLIEAIRDYRREQNLGVVVDFERDRFDGAVPFSRIGTGSMGGKARGLAFVNFLLKQHRASDRFPGVRIAVPPSTVLSTDIFDEFLDYSDLRDFAIGCTDSQRVVDRFLSASLSTAVEKDLAAFLQHVRRPLAVRSSSLLEDSQYQPFAGIYDTFMLPNNHADLTVRLAQLLSAIKRVYASTFSQRAKAYLDGTPYRLEEEKMAVVVQQIVGSQHGGVFYPDFAGVARSHNFYPAPPCKSDDGIAAVALGLGRTVMDGERCLRFCPRYPRHVLQFSSVQDSVGYSQREFWALDLGLDTGVIDAPADSRMLHLGLAHAEEHGTLHAVGSTFSRENDAVYDGLSRHGVRLVSFAQVLKHEIFPLAEILDFLLEIGEMGTSAPVEIEFAVNLSTPSGAPKEFGFLQMRPLALSREFEELNIGPVKEEDLVVESPSVLGHGRIDDICDVVVIDKHRFDRSASKEAASDVALLNAELRARRIPYLLIGVGRWGSTDPWLGIPVTWDQIAGVRVIVEAGFKDLRVTPSQGTHFFQNLVSSNVGYFTVNQEVGEGFVDWDWLSRQPALRETHQVRHLRFDQPFTITMNGKSNRGVIVRPGAESQAGDGNGPARSPGL